MESGFFGEPSVGNERPPRKGKKGNSEDKPKQPQRGLGVAQLEKIRLNTQMLNYEPNYYTNLTQEDIRMQTGYLSVPPPPSSSSSSFSFHGHQNTMMYMGELERANIRFSDSQTSTTSRTQYCKGREKKDRADLVGSGGENSKSSDTQELDLELRLSL